MGPAATPTRANRTRTVDVRDEATDLCLLADGQALREGGRAVLLAPGCPHTPQATWQGSGGLPGGRRRRPSPSTRRAAQSPEPQCWGLAISRDTRHHAMRWNMHFFL
jgi:hypothetical protein